MGQTLTNGIFLPNEGERYCYAGLAANWRALDAVIGGYNTHIANLDIHVTAADKTAWNGHVANGDIHVTAADKTGWNNHVGNSDIHVTAADKEAWNGKADASALTAHTGNTTIHVTATDKAAWNGKADASALTAHTGNTTIHVTATDKAAWNGKADASALTAHTGDTTIHVTAEDKNKWDAVTSKANDADVVHKSGDETATGIKSFSGTRTEFKRANNDGVVLFNNDSFNKGDTPSDTTYLCRKYYGGATSIPTAIGYSSVTVSDQGNRSMIQFYCLANTAGATTRTTLQMNYDKSLVGADAQYFNLTGSLLPSANNTYSLGNSSSKWKQLNGINPGALSFPDLSSGLDISSYLDTSQSSINYYTPPVDGWISIKGRAGVTIGIVIIQGDFAQMGYTVQDFGNTNRVSFCALPVRANQQVEIWLKSVTTIDFAKFYPCTGNV